MFAFNQETAPLFSRKNMAWKDSQKENVRNKVK